MPAIFFGHGNPMNALHDNAWTRGWEGIGRSIPKPTAIVSISAHWYIPMTAVTTMESPRTIHDFGGFPRELFEIQYPAPGSPEVALRIRQLIGDLVLPDHHHWGLDHGTWSVLCHVFPGADIPVIQLSIDETQTPAWHYEVGKLLAPLRDEGVLVIGSGDLVHNLHTYAWGKNDADPFDWAVEFEEHARNLIQAGDHVPLINYEALGRSAQLSIPTPDHYLPLLYILALQREGDPVTFPVEGFDGGSVSMLTVQIG
jgi:4,5-DOPA dioxygenase extradiol